MKSSWRKKEGFTLIETTISMIVIAIVSVSLYGAYTLLIKHTKSSEERQSIGIAGKRTLEDIKSAVTDKKITKLGENLVINDLSFMKNDDSSESKDLKFTKVTSEAAADDQECFKAQVHLDANYKYCKDTDLNWVYEGKITIEKAKGKRDGSKKSGDGIDKSKLTSDINIDTDEIDEEGAAIKNNINDIDYKFEMEKEEGKDKPSSIKSDQLGKSKTNISSDGDSLILNVYITKDGEVSIIDGSKKTCIETTLKDSLDNDSSKVNHVNIHFNFKEYLKEKDEQLKNLTINVYNDMVEPSKNVANIYIEKSVDMNVDVITKKGENYKYSHDDNKSVIKVGPLYNIQLKIARKEDAAILKKEQPTSQEKAKILFAGYSNKNIYIEEK